MRLMLRVIGGILALVVLCFIALTVQLLMAHRHAAKVAAKFTPGMTVESLVNALPYGERYLINVAARDMTVPCKNEAGDIHRPGEFVGLFPDMAPNDEEGEKISWEARQLPLQVDRFEPLDKHLRAQNDWARLIKAWTVFLEDDDAPKAVAYCRRGSAYLEVGDFDHAYRDARAACKLRNQEGCALLVKIPKDKAAAIEEREASVRANAPACEKPLRLFTVTDTAGERFRLYIDIPKGETEHKNVSRAEFADIIKREYQGREWQVRFTFDNVTPQHNTFVVQMGPAGRVEQVLPTVAWD